MDTKSLQDQTPKQWKTVSIDTYESAFDEQMKNRQQPVFCSVKLTANKKDLAVYKLPINVAEKHTIHGNL